jgi:DNA-binding response OmpR family regulator
MRHRPHLLVVTSEQDTGELELLGYFLRGAGFRVTWTHDTASSQVALQLGTIDCVVMDAVRADRSSNSVLADAMRLLVPAVILSKSLHSRDRSSQAYLAQPDFLPRTALCDQCRAPQAR